MSDHQAFFALLDVMETEKHVGPKRFFDLMRSSFSIRNLLYLDASLTRFSIKVHRLHHTFGPQVAAAYAGASFVQLDPFLKIIARGGIRPMDWSSVRQSDPDGEPVFRCAETLGLGTNGVTLPLTAPQGRIALLAIEAGLPATEWPAYQRCHLRDFQLLANLFHASLIEETEQHPVPGRKSSVLTSREQEVLGWAAAGKSYWEIGTILGISERTVRFFMTNTRRKLNVVSNAQAVAQAVRYALIPTF